MLEQFLITKKEISTAKVGIRNPLGLVCEKIIQNPRTYNTAQIRSAIENIEIENTSENDLPMLALKATEFILKDFFLHMHQNGLHNRQFDLWRMLGNITKVQYWRFQKGLIKKQDLNAYISELFIDPRRPSACIILNESNENNLESFKLFLPKVLSENYANRLKGIFYFTPKVNEEFMTHLSGTIKNSDPILKYESILINTQDVRLNVISYEKENNNYNFNHEFPELKALRTGEIIEETEPVA